MANPPDRSGPGQSGATAGANRFDDRASGAMSYPVESFLQGTRPSDDRLREMVVAALRDDGSGLDVTVKGGAVTLAGRVADDLAKRRIEDSTRRVPGVTAVDNRLGVP